MNVIIDKIEFCSTGRVAVYMQTGTSAHVAYLTVCKDSDGCKSIEKVDEWFFNFLFTCYLTRKFSDDLFMAYKGEIVQFPIKYSVEKYSDLDAVVRDLKAGVSTSEVERRHRAARG